LASFGGGAARGAITPALPKIFGTGIIPSTGTITEYAIPTGSSSPEDIAAGPDGKLWFAENDGNKIGKISP